MKQCFSSQTVSKYNSQYHKLFSTVPKEEILMKGDVLAFSKHWSALILEHMSD